MSVQRYTIQCFPHGFAKKDENGSWVGFDDYSALAAENERLRKAGDELLGNYYAALSDVSDFEKLPSVAQWLAAKEGDAK